MEEYFLGVIRNKAAISFQIERNGRSLFDELATCLYNAAIQHLLGHKLRTDTADGDPDLESAFYILKYTYAACVLTENGFMDSPLSFAFLESDEGKKPSFPSTWAAS